MNKKQKLNTQIMGCLESGAFDYKILNYLNGMPQHVRVNGIGDVYPSTGTWQGTDGKYHKCDPDSFILLLLGSDKPKTLEQRVIDLEEYVAYLESEILSIRSEVCHGI